MLQNMTIKTRLMTGLGIVIVAIAIVGLIGYVSAQRLAAVSAAIDKNGVVALQSLAEGQNALWELRFGISRYIAVPKPESRQKIIAASPKLFEAMDHALQQFGTSDMTPEARAAYVALTEVYGQYKSQRPGWFDLMEAGKVDEAAEYRSKTILVTGAGMVQALHELIDVQTKDIAAIEQSATKQVDATVAGIVGVTLAATVLAGFWIIRNLLAQLGGEPAYAMEVTRKITEGDLAHAIRVASSSGGHSVLLCP
jgi:methyl-accepting chemotaxis protein